ASNQVLGGFKSADLELVNTAVRIAAAAWGKWRNTAAPTRGKVLLEAARLMDQHREELARLISLEEGKALKDSRAEVQRSINITEFMSGEGRRFGGYTSGSESATKFAFTTRQPLGVVACITPWNFPLAIPAWKIAPALVAGNAVILKPASATPASAVRLAELYQEAGLPDGILNVLAARGGPAAEALLDAEEVRAVSLTGSTSTGRHVAARCAQRGDTVLHYLDVGRAEGASEVYSAQLQSLPSGHWLAPTVFDRVRPEMRVAKEEIFGPVLSMIRVPNAEAAFEAANAVEYGLAASV